MEHNLELKTPEITWIGRDLYIEQPDALMPVLDELRAIGYEVKDCRKDEDRERKSVPVEQQEQEGWYLWYAHLTDIRRGKCNSCQSYIATQGIQSHGHTCEVCGAITYLNIQDGSSVRFSFVGEHGYFPPELNMKAYRWDVEQADLYLYPEPLEHGGWGILKGEKAQEYLMLHQDKWEQVELDGKPYLKVKYADSPWTKDHEGVDTIDVRDIYGHYWNHKIVRLWQGQEYSEWGDFPLPESVIGYESWHWAPLPRSPKLHEQIIHAAGMISDQGWYHQDGRAAFDAIHWERMRIFVDRFTEIDVEEWDKAARRFRHDGPGAIADIARFCSPAAQVTNKPNWGNTLTALAKGLSGERLTEREVDAAMKGLEDRPKWE